MDTATLVCKLCKSDRIIALYRSRRYGFRVSRCAKCGLTFVLDQISEAQLKEMYSDEESFSRFDNLVSHDKVRTSHARVLREIRQWLQPLTNPPRLLDIGAGAGEFLGQARESGFEVYGNELSDAAIRVAYQRYGLVLSPVPLEHDQRATFFDVITMWGLIEHVLDPLCMLQHAFRLLRGRGILFIYTPTWCLYDDIGLELARISRWTRLLDRRITLAHLQLFSADTMRSTLTAIGFECLKIDSVCEYNLQVTAYLESLGIPMRFRGGLAVGLEQLVDRGLFFRNNMRIFCRKPL